MNRKHGKLIAILLCLLMTLSTVSAFAKETEGIPMAKPVEIDTNKQSGFVPAVDVVGFLEADDAVAYLQDFGAECASALKDALLADGRKLTQSQFDALCCALIRNEVFTEEDTDMQLAALAPETSKEIVTDTMEREQPVGNQQVDTVQTVPVKPPETAGEELGSLYDELMACETLEKIFTLLDKVGDKEWEALTLEQISAVEVKIESLEPRPDPAIIIEEHEEPVRSEIIYTTVNYCNVAPLVTSVTGDN